MAISLYKLQGAGNDFLIFDAYKKTSVEALFAITSTNNRSDCVAQLCNRRFGVGADGFIFIEPSSSADFKWDFYNADGSEAEMCGNATRCVGLWAHEVEDFNPIVSFETKAGLVTTEVLSENMVQTTMTPISEYKPEKSISIGKTSIPYDFINSGVPHVVLTVDDSHKFSNLKDLCSEIRNHKSFSPNGTNVTTLKAISPNEIESISFERGVEDFTFACGTGAVAAAYSHYKKNNTPQGTVYVPGGDLQVDFSSNNPKLTGPAHFIMRAELI